MARLDNRIVLIAGGGSGMGAEIARLFGREGAVVYVADLDPAGAATVAAESGGAGRPIALDVTDADDVDRAVSGIVAAEGRIDVLVNAVGISDFLPFETSTPDRWERVLRVCLTGTALTCRAAGAAMIPRGGGSIVNIASTAGLFGVPQMAAYTAAKHGVVGLTKALAAEWGRHRIRVNCICPGATLTPMLLATTPEYRNERIRRVPLGRLAEPIDQANVVLFLASDESAYVNGAILTVDGGIAALAPGTSDGAISG
jgi:NAD(P)-dependent dehydrogenase (short-subunit alcohol dehydrogenase family)